MIRSNSGSSRGSNFPSRKGFRVAGKRPLSPGAVLRYDPADAPADSDPKGTGGAEFSKDADMEVTGAGFVGGAGSVRPIQPLSTGSVAPAGASGLQGPQDEILISDAARSLSEMQMDPQVRAARLAEIRSAIESGTYDTPQRLEAAIEKMIAGWQRH